MNKNILLRRKTFAPLFFTQMGGAFNDNFLKSALLILFTYGGLTLGDIKVDVINNFVSAIFVLPFLLFAAFASQFADKFEKSKLMRALKLAELCIMLGAALALWLGSAGWLLLALFASGTQSACFSPLKYAILPQQLPSTELVAANSLLHMGTSMAILTGLIGGSAIAQLPGGTAIIAISGVVIAILGYLSSRSIPAAPSANPGLVLCYNPLLQYWRSFTYARKDRMVFAVIMGISWYWFVGSVFLTQLPNLVRANLSAGPLAVPIFLVLFLGGIVLGAFLTNALSRRRVEAGLVPLGGVLITLVGLYIYWAAQAYVQRHGVVVANAADLLSPGALFSRPLALQILLGFVLLGLVGGIFIVPLLSLLQARTKVETRAQVIGVTNFINATFMILAALFGAFMLGKVGISIAQLFAITALINLLILLWLVKFVPEFWQRFLQRFFWGKYATEDV